MKTIKVQLTAIIQMTDEVAAFYKEEKDDLYDALINMDKEQAKLTMEETTEKTDIKWS